MRPDPENRENIIMMLEGLEKMAGLLKAQSHRSRHLESSSPLIRRLPRFVREYASAGSLSAYKQKRKVRKAGLDRFLPAEGPDPMDRLAKDPDRYFSSEKIIVYTACFGGYDRVPEPVIRPDNIEYILLTDEIRPDMPDSLWKTVRLGPKTDAAEMARCAGDPILLNRWCKMHPHLLFPDCALSVYVDANILIVSDLTALTKALRPDGFPAAFFRHKQRDCVYDEIRACLIKGKDSKAALLAQEKMLRAHGIPEHAGLLEAPVIVRRHTDARCIALMDAWWKAFLAGSRRDQIALIDALHEMQIPVSDLCTLGNNVTACDLFCILPHTGGTR